MASNNREDIGQVQSDETLFAIIEEIYRRKATGVTEISNALGFPKSTIHRHLKTLEKHRYVVNDKGSYKLSFEFLRFGGSVRHSNYLCSNAEDYVRELADRSDKLATFTVKEHNRGVFTHRFNDKYGVKSAHVGTVFHLHQNAAGKAIVATLSDKEILQIIDDYGLPAETENTITDRDEFFRQIETIREDGFAVSIGEREEGAQSISAAVRDTASGDIGALSLTAPTGSISKDEIEERYAEMVVDIAGEFKFKIR